jgi:hypothetical protein
MMFVPKMLTFVGLLMAAASVVGQASAAAQPGTSVQCSWTTHPPGWLSVQGPRVGSVTCSQPFGTGRYHGTHLARLTPPTWFENNSSKLSFKRGTVLGKYRIAGIWNPMSAQHVVGTFRITGGTGQFLHIAGTLHVRCTYAPANETCHASGPVTGT